MTPFAQRKLKFSARLLLIAAGAVMATVPVDSGQASAAQAPSTSQTAEVDPAALFDVTAIHLHKPVPHEHSHIFNSNGRFTTVNVSARALIQWAFDMPASRIVGGPSWLNSTTFDIDAKSDNSLDLSRTYDSSAAKLEKRRRVQALMSDRFQLISHTETRELPIYALLVAKSGPRFRATQANGTTINGGRSHIQVEGGDDTVGLLAGQLAEALGRAVINKTGLHGRYNLSLNWTPDDGATPSMNGTDGSALASESSGPSIFTAIQEQLGLKLESQKGPVQVLFIDRIEMPSEN